MAPGQTQTQHGKQSYQQRSRPQHHGTRTLPVAPGPDRTENVARLPDEQGQDRETKNPVQMHGGNPLRIGMRQPQVAGNQLGSNQDDKQYVSPGVAHQERGRRNPGQVMRRGGASGLRPGQSILPGPTLRSGWATGSSVARPSRFPRRAQTAYPSAYP